MLYEAHVSLTGYVATQPVTRLVKEGVTNVTMRVAWTPRRQDRVSGEWLDGNTSYASVICWRKLATNAAVSLRKGDPVTLQGRLSVREFEDKEGRARTAVEIDASSIGHDLTRGVATFQRVRPQTGMTASEFAASRNGGEREPAMNDAGTHGNGGWGSATSGTGLAAASGGQSADGDGVPLPDEPDRPFFDESAISDDGESEQVAAAA